MPASIRSLGVIVLAGGLAGCAFRPSGDATGGDAPDGADTTDGPATGDGPATDGPDAGGDGATPQCPVGYEVHGTGTYRLVTATATWNAARADCEDDAAGGSNARHTHLVVLTDETERVGVRAAFGGPKLWLGLSDRVTTATWRWVTLEDTGAYPPATGSPWKNGQPNDGGGGDEDCVIMEGDGLWDDRLCDNDTEAYVCECDTHAAEASQSDPQM